MTFDLTTSTLTRSDAELLLEIKKITRTSVSLEDVLYRRPEFTLRAARAFLDRCADAGLVTWEGALSSYMFTEAATSLAMSKLAPRIDPTTAQDALAKVIEKARAWNADASNIVVVEELKLFGSMLFDRDDYGDVDIEAVVKLRPGSEAEIEALGQALPRSAVQGVYAYFERSGIVLGRAVKKAVLALDRSAKAASVTEEGTIERLGADWRQVYVYNASAGEEVEADPTYHPRTSPREEDGSSDTEKSDEFILPEVTPRLPEDMKVMSELVAVEGSSRWWGGSYAGSEVTPYKPDDPYTEEYIAAIMALEEIDPWPTTSDSPFGVVREVWERGVKEGLLADRGITLDLLEKSAFIDLPLTDVMTDDGAYERFLQLRISWSSSKRHLVLTPEISYCGFSEQPEIPSQYSNKAEHIAMARTLCPALYAMVDSLKMTGGVGVWLTIDWEPTEEEPVIPSIGGLMRSVGKAARDISVPKSMISQITSGVKKSRVFQRQEWIDLRLEQSIEVEIRSARQANLGKDNDGQPAVSVEGKLNVLYDSYSDEVELETNPHKEALLKASNRALKTLDGLGDSWILLVNKSHRLHPNGKEPTKEEIQKSLEESGVTLV